MYRIIKFKKKAWLKSHINMNIDLRKKAKNGIEKYFFRLRNNAVFGKTIENLTKHRDMKLVTTLKKKELFSVRTKLSC